MNSLYEAVDRNATIAEVIDIFEKIPRTRKAEYITGYVIREGNHILLNSMAKSGIVDITRDHLLTAARTSLDILKVVLKHYKYSINSDYDMACSAAASGNISILDFLRINFPDTFNWGPSMEALNNDNLEVFIWLETYYPNNVYYSFSFIDPSNKSINCAKYLYQKGHIPDPYFYDKAIKANNRVLIEWLREIKCPGTFDVEDTLDDYIRRIQFGLIHKTDLPWIRKLVSARKLPDLKIENMNSSIALIGLFSKILQFDKDDREYTLRYLVKHDLFKYKSAEEIYLKLSKLNLEQRLEIIDIIYTNKYDVARLYKYVEVFADDEDRVGCEDAKVISHIYPRIDWGVSFLIDIEEWLEFSYGSLGFADLVNTLWSEYEDKVPELQDLHNKEKWQELINTNPSYYVICDFINSLNLY